MTSRRNRARFLIAFGPLLGTLDHTFAIPLPEPLVSVAESSYPHVRDAALVQLAIAQARSCQAVALAWMDYTATQEVLTLVQLYIDGASDQAILEFVDGSIYRLSAAGSPWMSKARVWLDDALHELHRRHASTPHGFGEVIGVAGLTIDSEYSTRTRTRVGEILQLAELLTR